MIAPRLAVIGTSWGGLQALRELLAALPPRFRMPLVVVQHRSREATDLLRELLQDVTKLVVTEVEDKEPISAGHVYIAPPDYHLLVEEEHFALSVEEPVRFSRPSIDVTFGSAADAFGRDLVAVVLTGANDDGSRGLQYVVERGGIALVQDPESAESPIMPRAAIRMVSDAEVLPIPGIARRLAALSASDATQRSAESRRQV